MANSLLLLLLLFAAVAATKRVRAPFNASRIHPAVRASVMSEQALHNATRRANNQQVQGRNLISIKNRFRCDQKGVFPEVKQMLEHFAILAHQKEDENQVYFFYHEFFVQMSFVFFYRLFEDHQDEKLGQDFNLEHDYPFKWRKSYVRDKNNAFYLTTSTSWPEYGPVAKGNLNLINKPGSNPLATSEVLVERPGHNPESFQVDMDSKYFGYMHYVEHHLEHFRRKPGQYTILYWAPNRWLEIIYTTNQTIEFNIWDYGGSKYIKPAIQIQDWEVKQAVYMEFPSIKVVDGWEGQMIELDTAGMMHFHRYTFKLTKGVSLRIERHFHYEMSFLDFFNCQQKAYYPLRRKNQLKGIIIALPAEGVKEKARTFIFIDLFYFVFDGDLMPNGFNLYDPELKKRAYELRFETDSKTTKVERLSTKFVKHLPDGPEDSKPVFTFDRSKTFEISKRSSKEQLIFRETTRKAHLCSHSTLWFNYGRTIICIYKRFYKILSLDYEHKMRPIVDDKEIGFFKRPLADVFRGSPAEFDDDVEYVFDYGKEWVVFVTYHWLLAFKREDVFATMGNTWLSDFVTELFLKTHDLDEKIFKKKPNCLWTRCDPDHAHLSDNVLVPSDFAKGRSFAAGLNATQAKP